LIDREKTIIGFKAQQVLSTHLDTKNEVGATLIEEEKKWV